MTGDDGEVIHVEVRFTLDALQTPKAIDFQDDLLKRVNRGIYLLDKEQLTICTDTERAKGFTVEATKDTKHHLVLLLRRVTPWPKAEPTARSAFWKPRRAANGKS